MEAKINLTRMQAAQVYSLIYGMTGGVSFRAKREEVQKRIGEVWPEILEKDAPAIDTIDKAERRPVLIDERQQKALAEGLLALVKQEKANGADYKTCLDMAGILRLSAWFRKAVATEEVPEFSEPLDDEPDLMDAETILDSIEQGAG